MQVDGGLEVIGRLFTANEGFRGQIRNEKMSSRIAEVRTMSLLHQGSCRPVKTRAAPTYSWQFEAAV